METDVYVNVAATLPVLQLVKTASFMSASHGTYIYRVK